MKKISLYILILTCACILFNSCGFIDDFFSITRSVSAETDDVGTKGESDDDTASETVSEKISEALTERETNANVSETEAETETETETDEVEKETESGSGNVDEKVFDFSIAPEDDGIPTVILDPGHGFDDPGCTSKYLNGLYEKDITLKTVYKIKAYLENAGCRVLLTHDGTSYPDEDWILETAVKYGFTFKRDKFTKNNIFYAYERIIYADILCIDNDADAFVSVHANANPDSDSASGFVIDYCAENDFSKESKKLFESVKDSLRDKFPNTPIESFEDSWEDAYIVTKYVLMPSVLVEMGYTTTKSDAEKILDDEWLDEFSATLSEGIISFLGL